MEHLEDIAVADLHDALDEVDRKKPAQRLLAAIAFKNGVTQTELAEWNDVQRKTIYSWLNRFETERHLAEAATDGRRTGRNRKLSGEEHDEFEQAVQQPPTKFGFDHPAWTPALVQQYLEDTYGVEYSLPSCRRLLKEAGLSYRNPRAGKTSTVPKRWDEPPADLNRDEKWWLPG